MSEASPAVLERARAVRLAIFDVDGVMTDGTLYIGAQGEAFKAFNILDGHGMKMLQAAGVATAILSGRASEAVARRAAELSIAHVVRPDQDVPTQAGRVVLVRDGQVERPAVATGDGTLLLDTVALEGKRPADGADFVRGYRAFVGAELGG